MRIWCALAGRVISWANCVQNVHRMGAETLGSLGPLGRAERCLMTTVVVLAANMGDGDTQREVR